MDALAGVDGIPWATLDHCYGASNDIPDLLRQTVDGSDEALDRLDEYMIHQRTLYAATPYLVRFLARIAASGVLASQILPVLGIAADFDGDEYEEKQDPSIRGKTRAALAAEVPALVPLLADPDGDVRDTASWALPQSRAAGVLVSPLRERWHAETVPAIAASVLRGLSLLAPEDTVPLAVEALDREDSLVRLAGAHACAKGGVPWSANLTEAALAWTADDAPIKHFQWSFWSGHPFSDLLTVLAERGDPLAAAELASAALTRPVSAGVRETAVSAAGGLAEMSRGATPRLIEPLISVAAGDDTEAGQSAILHLRQMGGLDQAADQLAAVADATGPSRRADWALTCLLEASDPRCVPLIIRDWRHRRFAVGAMLGIGRSAVQPPFAPGLLEKIRVCLRGQLLGEEATPKLVRLIGSWGPDAAEAVPDLLAVLPRHGYAVGWALADIAGPHPEAIRLIRQEAVGGTRVSLYAAGRLHALTGDEPPLLAAIESCLTQSTADWQQAAEQALTLGPSRHLVPALADALQSLLAQSPPDYQARAKVALALWHHSGDPSPVLNVLTDEFETMAARPKLRARRGTAADTAAALGPLTRPLIPEILPLLEYPRACPSAIRALIRIDPEGHGGVPLEKLADCLSLTLGQGWWHTQFEAVELLSEIGLKQFPGRVVTRLRELADQDRRIKGGGAAQEHIRNDDCLRAAILGLLGGKRT